jgi:hypothetical protein
MRRVAIPVSVGGVPNFGVRPAWFRREFVVEADEYDTAFFDKRSKLCTPADGRHPQTTPSTTTPISSDLAAIQRHHSA